MAEKAQAETIFGIAIEIGSVEGREAFLGEACHGDPTLRQEVEKLVQDYFRAGKFLERPVAQIASLTIDQPLTEKPGNQIGPYKLREQIGEGGFGVVFVAEQERPVARKVALKVIKPGMDTRTVIARFEAERQALALMDHSNIARVLDAGSTENGRPYFVMELVKGTSITQFCDAHKLGNGERLKLFVQVCRAVQHAHQKGIIHRDLKPSNVMVTMQDDQAIPKIIDFGVAKALSQKLTDKTIYTAYGELIGTPLYMSPEQAQLNEIDVDTRSDVYSLGILLYELLTGTTPFDGEAIKQAGWDEMRRIVREDEPPRPSERVSTLQAEQLSTISDRRSVDTFSLAHALRRELDWIVMKALEKDRNRRYESAGAMAADVERYLNLEPVQACPPTMFYLFRKYTKRNKVMLWTAVIVLTSLFAGIASTSWQAVRARHALTRALAAEERARANLDQAMLAVDRLLTRVGADDLGDTPRATAIRRDLLHDAECLYKSLATLNPERPELNVDVAKANRRLATIQFELGAHVSARQSAQRALELLSQGPTLRRDLPQWRLEAAQTRILLGRVRQSASAEDGLTEYRRAIRRMVLGAAWMNLGTARFQLRQAAQAQQACDESLAILENLVREFPLVPEYRRRLANTCMNVGAFIGMQHRDLPQAIANAEKAEVHTRFLVENFGYEASHHHLFAGSLTNLAVLLRHRGEANGRPAQLVIEAIRHERIALQSNPSRYEFRLFLVKHQFALTQIQVGLGKLDDAAVTQANGLKLGRQLVLDHPDSVGVADLVRALEEIETQPNRPEPLRQLDKERNRPVSASRQTHSHRPQQPRTGETIRPPEQRLFNCNRADHI